MKVKRFKNMNYSIKLEKEDIKKAKDNNDLFINILNELYKYNFLIASDKECIGNYLMSYTLYNSFENRVYKINDYDIINLSKGKTSRLLSCEMKEEEMKAIREYCYR